ncbi:MAG: hypothetical protein IJ134_05135 [Bacilli bacterium]|nr:hypothetical protein [Bacilli bacterium]
MNILKKYILFIAGIFLFLISFLSKNLSFLKFISFIFLIINLYKDKKINLDKIIITVISIISFIINKNDSIIFLILYIISIILIEKLDLKNDISINQKKIFNKSKIYTICVSILSIFIFILYLVLSNKIYTSISKFVLFLIISNLNLFRISIKYLYNKVNRYCTFNKVKIKSNSVLENLYKCKNVCIEKSNIITTGNYEITKIIPYYKKEEEILFFVAHAEYKSDHGIAKCIKDKYKGKIDENIITKFNEYKNLGIIAKINDDEVIVGNEKLFSKKNIQYPKVEFLDTAILVALNNNYIGTIVLKDEIKFESFNINNLFNEVNIDNIIIISSDEKKVVKKMAQNLNINKFYYNLSQNDKLNIISKLGCDTLFISDTIENKKNISFVLASTNKNSDLVLSSYDISNITKTIKASFDLNKKIKRYTIITIISKIIFGILTILNLINIFIMLFIEMILTLFILFNIKMCFKEVK